MIRSIAVLASFLLLGGLAALALQRAQERQARSIDLLEQQLVDSCARAPHLRARMGNLPEPVRRYLQRALPDPDRRVSVVRLSQHGELRRSVDSPRWMPFDARQVISPDVTGFVWNAKVEVAPFVHVRVLDSLVAGGGGGGQVLLQSAIGVAQDSGTPEITSGALHRFLAEAVWYPWALLPSLHLHWTGIDSNRALATLTAHGTAVSLEFSFSDDGKVTRIYTPGRWGSFDGGYAKVAWEGHFSDYQYRDGVLIPLQGEVGWIRDGALQLVWKGRIDAFSATVVPPLRTPSPPRRDPA